MTTCSGDLTRRTPSEKNDCRGHEDFKRIGMMMVVVTPMVIAQHV